MTDAPADEETTDASTDASEGVETTLATSGTSYKVLGELTDAGGIGVLGRNTAGSGTPVGVQGVVPNATDGYGLSTPDDVRIEGAVDTDETDFVVEAGTTDTGDAKNVVMGHASNTATSGAVGAVVGGGGNDDGSTTRPNEVTADYATVGGGDGNTASGEQATVGGGILNTAGDRQATVAGGGANTASSIRATVAGGNENTASGENAIVGAGFGNTASALDATVGGGVSNTASGRRSTVAGGEINRTGKSGTSKGTYATVPGGQKNVAREDYSFAAGRRAKALNTGAFVWADDTAADFASNQSGTSGSPTGVDTFHVRATGGVRFVTGLDSNDDPNAGAYLSSGGSSWQTVSARSAKHDVRPVDPRSVLAGVESLEVSRWAYDARPGVDRMGPMAGEFHETFELGDDPETIGHVDADGVALAAIQGLSERLDDARAELDERDDRIDRLRADLDRTREELAEKDDRIDDLERETDRIDDLEAENERLRERLAALEARVDTGAAAADD